LAPLEFANQTTIVFLTMCVEKWLYLWENPIQAGLVSRPEIRGSQALAPPEQGDASLFGPSEEFCLTPFLVSRLRTALRWGRDSLYNIDMLARVVSAAVGSIVSALKRDRGG
jgi:hypothetical protein